MGTATFRIQVHLRHAVTCGTLFVAAAAAGEGLFTDVPKEVFPDFRFNTRGMAWGDYDNDGWTDIFCASDSRLFQMALMHNEGNGRFSERPGHIHMKYDPHQPNGAGVLFGDYDNDGDLDLFLSVGGGRSRIAPRGTDFCAMTGATSRM